MKKLLAILIFSYTAYLIFVTSCANPGMPTGGDKDTIPPVILKTVPEMNTVNYKGNSVSLTFNEFIISDEVGTKLLISPPVAKQPQVRTKSKTLTIELGDSLRQNVTYTLDFRDAIADNNEKNPLKNFRFAFSTGPDFDTLMVGGYVLNAENMEPLEEATVMLYDQSDSVSSFRKKIPKYIAKTDKTGFYTFTNIGPGKYHLFALEDADNSYTYNQPGERIAFYDSLVVPVYPEISGTVDLDSIFYEELKDSLKAVVDTLAESKLPAAQKPEIKGLSEMVLPVTADADSIRPGRQAPKANMVPHYLLLFKEVTRDNFLDDYKRDQRNTVRLIFSNSVTDSFRVHLLTPRPSRPDWSYMEYSLRRDSISLWITDSLVSKADTMNLQVSYEILDSLQLPVMKTDTLELVYTDPVRSGRRRKAREEKEAEQVVRNFTFQMNTSNEFDSFEPIVLEAAEPLEKFDFSKVHVFQKVDSLEETIPVQPEQDSIRKRKFRIRYPWKFESTYRLQIDSAAAVTYTGQVSAPVNQSFTIQKENYYGIIDLHLTRVPGNCIVQLLKNTENEEVVKQSLVEKDGRVELPFIKPEKYKLRLIVDRNKNGVWDTGDLDEWKQPERVVYYHKIMKIRSNFVSKEEWVLPDDIQPKKELIDDDAKDKKGAKGKKTPAKGRPGGPR